MISVPSWFVEKCHAILLLITCDSEFSSNYTDILALVLLTHTHTHTHTDSALWQHTPDGLHHGHEPGKPEDGGQGHLPLPLHQEPRVPPSWNQDGIQGGEDQHCKNKFVNLTQLWLPQLQKFWNAS